MFDTLKLVFDTFGKDLMVRFKSYGQPAKNNEKKDGMGY